MTGNLLRVICLVSAGFYYLAFAASYRRKEKGGVISFVLWMIGLALNASIVINNWVVNGYMPFVSMYQVLTFLGATYGLIYIYIRYAHGGGWMKRYLMISQAVIMTGVFFMAQDAQWTFPPALQSPFFIPHVFSYMVSYTLVALAAILCVVSFLVAKEQKKKYEGGVYQLISTGFPFMVTGMLLGALWANECWGNYWSWDHKEAWSLVTVLSLSVYLHFRRQERLKKYAIWFVLLAIVFEIVTLFFVGMFGGDSMHAYS
jgi:ABC-type transport system involved in cytochrome c biogenesis permease subunit